MIKKITKKQFDTAYNKYQPSKWIKFAYRYFSKETTEKDLVLKKSIIFIFIGVFLIGFVGVVFNASKNFIKVVTIGYSIFLLILVLYLFSAVFLNNRRIKKIRKELGNISGEEYNTLVENLYS